LDDLRFDGRVSDRPRRPGSVRLHGSERRSRNDRRRRLRHPGRIDLGRHQHVPARLRRDGAALPDGGRGREMVPERAGHVRIAGDHARQLPAVAAGREHPSGLERRRYGPIRRPVPAEMHCCRPPGYRVFRRAGRAPPRRGGRIPHAGELRRKQHRDRRESPRNQGVARRASQDRRPVDGRPQGKARPDLRDPGFDLLQLLGGGRCVRGIGRGRLLLRELRRPDRREPEQGSHQRLGRRHREGSDQGDQLPDPAGLGSDDDDRLPGRRLADRLRCRRGALLRRLDPGPGRRAHRWRGHHDRGRLPRPEGLPAPARRCGTVRGRSGVLGWFRRHRLARRGHDRHRRGRSGTLHGRSGVSEAAEAPPRGGSA